jgi:hypothetical protein
LLVGGAARVLGEILGQADVPDDPRQPGDEPGRLHSPHRVNRTVDHVAPAPRRCHVGYVPGISPGSKIRWIVPCPSPTICQKRFESSIASSFEPTSTIAQPTTASFA